MHVKLTSLIAGAALFAGVLADEAAVSAPAVAFGVRGAPARNSASGANAAPGVNGVAGGNIGAGERSVAAATGGNLQATAVDPLLEQSIGFYTGAGGQVDDARAHELLLQAIEDGDPLSMMWLARCHSRGRMNFDQDRGRAREIAAGVIGEVRRLADNNVAEAAFLMGTAYAEGLGVEADEETAFDWYFRAANLDNALAAHNLGNAYREGDGMPYDPRVAFYWYRRAAERGDALPMFWLGEMYESGEGVEQDLEQARRWYRESAERGRDDARQALERLGG